MHALNGDLKKLTAITLTRITKFIYPLLTDIYIYGCTFNGHSCVCIDAWMKMKCYINVTIWYWIYGQDFKHFATLLKHYM